MAMVIGIGGVSGGKKSTTAKIFDEELTALGLKTAWPKKYIVRPKRKVEDPNTICVNSEEEIPSGVTKWSIDGKIVGYDISEIKEMLANDVWPIVLSSSLDLLFDIKKDVEISGSEFVPDPESVDINLRGIIYDISSIKFHFMRIFYCSSYFTQGENLRNLISIRSDISDEMKEIEFKKRSAEVAYFKQQQEKYVGYLVLPNNVIITKIFDESVVSLDNIRKDVKHHLDYSGSSSRPNVYGPVDIDRVNKFFMQTDIEDKTKNGNVNEWMVDNIDYFVDAALIHQQENFDVPAPAEEKDKKQKQ